LSCAIGQQQEGKQSREPHGQILSRVSRNFRRS
jgi:hypothetical protein